jgi:hypothetical protein
MGGTVHSEVGVGTTSYVRVLFCCHRVAHLHFSTDTVGIIFSQRRTNIRRVVMKAFAVVW